MYSCKLRTFGFLLVATPQLIVQNMFRLGFLVDFLSHAAIVGFMGGAAIVIGLQQLKGLLGISHFTTKTDVVSVLESVFTSIDHPVSPDAVVKSSSVQVPSTLFHNVKQGL